MKGKKKNLNKCKSIQSGLLQDQIFSGSVVLAALYTWAADWLRAGVIEGDLQSDSR